MKKLFIANPIAAIISTSKTEFNLIYPTEVKSVNQGAVV